MEKKEMQRIFSENLRKHRALQAKNQEEVAFQADMSTAYYSELERGLKCPTVYTVYKLANALNISPFQLIQFNGEFDGAEAFEIIKQALKTVPEAERIRLAYMVEALINAYQGNY